MILKCANLLACTIFLLLFLPASTAGQDNTEAANFTFHSVLKNETVFSIAKGNGINPEDIFLYNPKSRESIKPGDVLQIPKPNFTSGGKTKSKKGDQSIMLHKVRKNETLYFISQIYKCSQEEILKLNPGFSGSIKKGTVLKVPNPDYNSQSAKTISVPDKFLEYRIVSGDNYFNLKKRFGIDKEELIQLNPALKNGMNAGLMIRITVKNAQPDQEVKSENQPLTNEEKLGKEGIALDPDRTYNLAIYLPFCGNLNDSSNLSTRTTNYLEFYEGAILAVDKMASVGMKVKLYVYDTYQDPKVVEQLVKRPEFLSLDLIVGPVYPDCQKIITELCAKNQIPMISPLSSDSRYVSVNPYYFQINPDRKFRLNGTADYIINEYSSKNIIVLNHGINNSDQRNFIDGLREKISDKDLHICNLWSEGVGRFESLLKPEVENIIVMTEDDEANVSVAVTRLNTVSKKLNVTLVGLQEYTRLQSINIEYLHNLKFHYLAPYFIDYRNQQVKSFIEKYRLNYSAEPTQFSFQGYDVTTNFLMDLRFFGKKFVTRNPIPKTNLLQAKYNFKKATNFGGYANHTLFVIEYTDNYEVKLAGQIKVAF